MDELFEELEDVSRVQELDKVKDQAIALFGRSKPMQSKENRRQSKSKTKDTDTPRNKEKCSRCQKLSHNEKECWKKHPELLPQKYKDRNAKRKADAAELAESENAKRINVLVL